jgi:4-hydroxybenzoyl-CoA thioesterase
VTYHRDIQIEFGHCDPAGIVFYPRYFEMINSLCENFFKDIGQFPYHRMMAQHQGVPTARVEVDFHHPSRLGEVLDFRLEIARLGTSSITFGITAWEQGINRFTCALTLVWVSPQLRAEPWPDDLRARLAAFMEAR